MKINKIRPKFHFFTITEIKITCLVFLFCYLFRAIWKPLFRCLRFWVVLNNKKYGKAGNSEADRSSLKLHKFHKNGLNLTKIAVKLKLIPIICLFLLCFWSLWWGFILLPKHLILNFFHPSFLSRDVHDWPVARPDVISSCSKLTSQQQFGSVREWAWCIASSTLEGSLHSNCRQSNCVNTWALAQCFGTLCLSQMDPGALPLYCLWYTLPTPRRRQIITVT